MCVTKHFLFDPAAVLEFLLSSWFLSHLLILKKIIDNILSYVCWFLVRRLAKIHWQLDKNRYTFAKLVCCQDLYFEKILFINEIDIYNLILKDLPLFVTRFVTDTK